MQTLRLVVGILLVLGGGVFFLQGIGMLPGSYMTGDPTWAWIGGAMVVAGAALLAWSWQGRRA